MFNHSKKSIMKKAYFFWASLFTLLTLGLTPSLVQASTFENIASIFENKCQTCHNSTSPAGDLDLSGDLNSIYSNLNNADPSNSGALSRGDKLIFPGDPYRSFLLRKTNKGLMHELDGGTLSDSEGGVMPPYGTEPLTDLEFELIRQWILFGAKQDGDLPFNTETLIEEYYLDGGYSSIDRPAAPAPGTGFQIHVGPIFMDGFDEKEFLLRYKPQIFEETEVNRVELIMDEQSHHFIIYNFDSPSQANSVAPGLREVSLSGGELPFFNSIVTAWQDNGDMKLPGGTAYFWDETSYFDLNYHIPNYSGEAILPANAYINVYTQPVGTAIKEMKADLWTYSNVFFFLNPGETTLSDPFNVSQNINLWYFTSHTHKYGTDYDLYRLDQFGNIDEQLFEGYWDYENCDCNIGFYDWDHPPVKIYEPYVHLPAGTQLLQEATFNNTSSGNVSFGLTTDDEMFLAIVQYTTGNPMPYVMLNSETTTFCESNTVADLIMMPADGELSGSGVVGGVFNPSLAGVGTHTLAYTFEDITSWHTVTVIPSIDAPIISEDNNILGVADIYDSYQWYVNGEAIEGADGNAYFVNSAGNYSVAVSIGTCTAASEALQLTVGIADNFALQANSINIYPNPFKTQTTISYTLKEATSVHLELFDLKGQKVAELINKNQNLGKHSLSLDVNQATMPEGMYLLKIRTKNTVNSYKLLVQK